MSGREVPARRKDRQDLRGHLVHPARDDREGAAPGRSLATPTVFLLDAYVQVFRAYHALPDMRTPAGLPIGAAYGFAATLVRWLAEARPSHAACAFDHAMTSFRNALEPGYKAGRGEPPAELAPQLAPCREVARALGLAVLEAEGFEADDVIASASEHALAAGCDVVVLSSDKDLAQLVRADGRVLLHDLARMRTLDADGVRARYGVPPGQIPDWLGLVGDAVDSLPGVPGIGPRTAAALLGAFGSIEAVPDDPAAWRAAGVRGGERLAAAFAAHRDRALRTRMLATLRRDVPDLASAPDACAWRGPDPTQWAALCERSGWSGLRERGLRLAGD